MKKKRTCFTQKKGFTLIEMLVVMVIIAVLAGVLLPAIMKSMRQAKTNRCLSEMQHLATVVSQVYNEVGYYVPLEDMTITGTTGVDVWTSSDYVNGKSDNEATTDLSTLSTSNMWAGPYATYKSYYANTLSNYTGNDLPIPYNVWDVNSTINTQLTNAPLDPWGRPCRMFWTTLASLKPAGATGTMVLISAGSDGILQSLIGQEQRPTRAQQAAFSAFDPNNSAITEKDPYFVFNVGIQ
ncbi:MAG: type II secretion system protein [Candidatus Omnitrophota bacterium]